MSGINRNDLKRLSPVTRRIIEQALRKQRGPTSSTVRPAVPNADMERVASDEPVAAKKGPQVDTLCRVRVLSKRIRLADADGISSKAALDGLVRRGVLRDDSTHFVRSLESEQAQIQSPEEESTIIELYEAGDVLLDNVLEKSWDQEEAQEEDFGEGW